MPDYVALDRQAVEASVAVVSGVRVTDLDRATPCGDWDLRRLLEHMTAQHRGFAAAAAGAGFDLEPWRLESLGDDPVKTYREAAERVLAAFAAQGSAGELALPQISTAIWFPVGQAISFHFIDYVVHSWDVAASLGQPFRLPDDLLEPALVVAEAVPNGAKRQRPGAGFRPALPAPDGVSTFDKILLRLGRSPDWSP